MNPSDWIATLTAAPAPDALLLLAAVLVGGALAGEALTRHTGAPRVLGYTLAGVVAALVGGGTTVPLAGAPRLVIDLALALLLFEIGASVRLRWLRHNPGLLATSLAESLLGALAVWLALRDFGLAGPVAAACAVLAVPASAAMAGRVAHEAGAEGQVTQRMQLLTALNTLYAVLAMVVFKAWAAAEQRPDWPEVLADLALSLAGSLALAAALALSVAHAARRLDLRHESAVLLLLGLVLLAVSAARWAGLSTLLVPLLAGLALRNTTERPWTWPRHFGTAGGVLVLLMFVYVGATWSPATLAAGGAAAVVLVLARAAGKAAAAITLAPWARASVRQGTALAITLTPLSVTVLVMAGELAAVAPALGQQVLPVMVSAVLLMELLGPLGVWAALRLAGDLARQRGEPQAAAPSR